MPHYNFWLLIRGEAQIRTRGKVYRVEPGTCFLFTPGDEILGESSSEPFVNFAVHFFPKPLVNREPLLPLFGRKARRIILLIELAQHCSETYKRGDDLGLEQAKLAALQMMLQLWCEAHTPISRDEDEKIIHLLSKAGAGGEVPIPALAKRLGLSGSQLTRRVRAITGLSPREYLIRERIGEACSILGNTSHSIDKVAEILGYSDPSYFIRQFQKVMKTTPAGFRRQAARFR